MTVSGATFSPRQKLSWRVFIGTKSSGITVVCDDGGIFSGTAVDGKCKWYIFMQYNGGKHQQQFIFLNLNTGDQSIIKGYH